jgi:hypothetical protein
MRTRQEIQIHQSMSNPRKKLYISRVAGAFAILNIACLICYICFTFAYQFHADDAVANTLAQEILDSGHFFPPQWRYANGDVWVLFLHVIELPLLFFMPNGYSLHAAASLVGAALILLSIWQLCKMAAMSRQARWAALAVFAGGISPNMAENLFGQQAYGIMLWMSALIMLAAWKYVQLQNTRRHAWAVLLMLLVMLAAWGNPQRALVYMVLPMLFGLVMICFQARNDASFHVPAPRRIALLALMALGAGAVGSILNGKTLAINDGMAHAMDVLFLSFDNMVRNTGVMLHGLLSLLGGLPGTGTPVLSLQGVLAALRLLNAVGLLLLLPWALWRAMHSERPGQVFLASAAAVSMSISGFVFLTTTVADTTLPESSIRYLVPGLAAAILVLVQLVVDGKGIHTLRVMGMAALGVLVLSAPDAYDLKSFSGVSVNSRNASNERMAIVRFLQSQNARYGYASYWNAGNNTVLSDHTIKVRQIEIADGLPRPMRWLSSDSWYEQAAWRGASFLLLSNAESALVDWPTLTRLCGEPRRTTKFKDMTYYEFEHNIADDLPSWSMMARSTSHYLATAATPHEIGQFDAISGAMRAARGQSGALRFGPYATLPPGRYEVRFDLRAEGDNKIGFGHADATAKSGSITLAQANIVLSGKQTLVLTFDVLKKVQGVEYRVFSNGAGALAWTNVTVQGEPLPASSQGVTHGR